MRVALVAPLYEAVPPVMYGGTERVIAGLADELVEAGHEVTLFAAGSSRTRAGFVAGNPSPLRISMTRQELTEVAPHLHLKMLSEVYRRSDDFDVIHAHTDIWTLPFVEGSDVPTVVTLHGRLDLDVVRQVLPMYPSTSFVSISESQRAPLADLPIRWAGTCYNGLPLDAYLAADTAAGPGDYLAFVGRITPEKRPDWAVEVARRAGLPLRVAAKVDPLDLDYWNDEIEPLFASADVDFIGEIAEADKPEFYAKARATLFPIDWPEPFGLVMVESMAAGTPVIALDHGSVSEVIDDGRTGFVCRSLDEMVRAVGRVGELSTESCRAGALRFSAAAMAEGYTRIYETVIRSSVSRRNLAPFRPSVDALTG